MRTLRALAGALAVLIVAGVMAVIGGASPAAALPPRPMSRSVTG